MKHGDHKFPPFAEFVRFITEMAEVQCLPVLCNLDLDSSAKDDKNRVSKESYGNRRNKEVTTLITRTRERSSRSPVERNESCYWCGHHMLHDLNSCDEFSKKPLRERRQFIITKGLCLRCLTHGHMAKENKCQSPPPCTRLQADALDLLT